VDLWERCKLPQRGLGQIRSRFGCISLKYDIWWEQFLTDRSTVALMLQCCVCLSSRRLSVTLCIVAKRGDIEQKLLLTACRKSYMRNRLIPKWMTLTFIQRSFKVTRTTVLHSPLNISEITRDWPRKVKFVTPIRLAPISQKQLEMLFRNNRRYYRLTVVR